MVLEAGQIIDLWWLAMIRADTVDPDAVAALEDGQVGGEVGDGGLHGAVHGLTGITPQALDRMEVDDRAAAVLDHRVEEGVGYREEVEQVDVVHRLPGLWRRIL